MRILSAMDAISPAVARTRDLLFHPFRWGTFLKLCAVAVFTEGLSGRSHWKGGGGRADLGAGPIMFSISPQMLAAIISVSIAVLLLGIALFYLSTRLRFALFDCLVHQSTEIRPGWHIYREPANRFFWLSIGVGIGYLAFAATVLSPFAIAIYRRLHETGAHSLTPAEILAFILPMLPIVLLLVFVAIAVDIVLRDFMLPHIALDNATAGEALEAVWNRIVAEKGSFLLYSVLRILLPLLALIALGIALLIPGIILFGGGGVLIAALKAAATGASAGAVFGSALLRGLLGVAIVALAVFLAVIFGGPLSIAVRNYALMFYGGRYRELGDTLSPPQTGGAGLPA